MGFMEEQRRLRQIETDAEQRKEAERQAESKRFWDEVESKKRHIAQCRELYEKSAEWFRESGLQDLIRELGRLKRYQSYWEYEPILSDDDRKTLVCRMDIKSEPKGEMTEVKWIGIETDAEGTITFKAGFLGSSSIIRSHWQGNRSILEDALGKAYHHPKSIRYKPEAPRSPDVGPGI